MHSTSPKVLHITTGGGSEKLIGGLETPSFHELLLQWFWLYYRYRHFKKSKQWYVCVHRSSTARHGTFIAAETLLGNSALSRVFAVSRGFWGTHGARPRASHSAALLGIVVACDVAQLVVAWAARPVARLAARQCSRRITFAFCAA